MRVHRRRRQTDVRHWCGAVSTNALPPGLSQAVPRSWEKLRSGPGRMTARSADELHVRKRDDTFPSGAYDECRTALTKNGPEPKEERYAWHRDSGGLSH